MIIATPQINLVIGDFEGNYNMILADYRRACEAGAELVVYSELTFFGYPACDLLLRAGCLREQNKYFDKFREQVGEVGVIIGLATPSLVTAGKSLHNSAVLIVNRQLKGIWHKTLLPNYDVFDERRYFEPNPEIIPVLVNYRGQRLGVLICEDIWPDEFKDAEYDRNPVAEMAKMSPDILITLNASPYYWGKANVCYDLVASVAQIIGCPVVYVNEMVKWVVDKVDSNEYKRRQMPLCLKVSGKAFGTGRRLPIVAKYKS